MVTKIELFESVWCPNLTPLEFCLWGWIKSEGYKRKVDTRDELLARILAAAARIKERADQLRRTTRDLRKRVSKYIEVDGGIFEHLLWTVTNLSFKHWIKIKIKLTVSNISDSNNSISVTIQN